MLDIRTLGNNTRGSIQCFARLGVNDFIGATRFRNVPLLSTRIVVCVRLNIGSILKRCSAHIKSGTARVAEGNFVASVTQNINGAHRKRLSTRSLEIVCLDI